MRTVFDILSIYFGGNYLECKYGHVWWVGVICVLTLVTYAAWLYWRMLGLSGPPLGTDDRK